MKQLRWSDYEEAQARKFIDDRIAIFGYGLDKIECIEIAWVAYFETRIKFRNNLTDPGYWDGMGENIDAAIIRLRKKRNGEIRYRSRCSLNTPIGENKEELRSRLPIKGGNFVDAKLFWMFVKELDASLREVCIMLINKEDEAYTQEKNEINSRRISQKNCRY